MLGDNARQNVFPEIVGRFRILGVRKKDGNEKLGIEDINTHGSVTVCRFVRGSLRLGGLFLEAADAPMLVGFDNAELLGSFRRWNFERRDGNVSAGIDVLLKHLGVIHFVDMVARKDEHEFAALAAYGVNILINGIGGPLVPLLRNTHLRRKNFDVLA